MAYPLFFKENVLYKLPKSTLSMWSVMKLPICSYLLDKRSSHEVLLTDCFIKCGVISILLAHFSSESQTHMTSFEADAVQNPEA